MEKIKKIEKELIKSIQDYEESYSNDFISLVKNKEYAFLKGRMKQFYITSIYFLKEYISFLQKDEITPRGLVYAKIKELDKLLNEYREKFKNE